VKDPAARARLSEAANGQAFVRQAPVVLACCVDLGSYVDDSLRTVDELAARGDLEPRMAAAMVSHMESLRAKRRDELVSGAAFNIGIAGEHIALRAVELGLGSCWVKAFDEAAVRGILGLGEGYFVSALIPLGYPDESPPPRRHKGLEEIVLP
jgi:nitroreductase